MSMQIEKLRHATAWPEVLWIRDPIVKKRITILFRNVTQTWTCFTQRTRGFNIGKHANQTNTFGLIDIWLIRCTICLERVDQLMTRYTILGMSGYLTGKLLN